MLSLYIYICIYINIYVINISSLAISQIILNKFYTPYRLLLIRSLWIAFLVAFRWDRSAARATPTSRCATTEKLDAGWRWWWWWCWWNYAPAGTSLNYFTGEFIHFAQVKVRHKAPHETLCFCSNRSLTHQHKAAHQRRSCTVWRDMLHYWRTFPAESLPLV